MNIDTCTEHHKPILINPSQIFRVILLNYTLNVVKKYFAAGAFDVFYPNKNLVENVDKYYNKARSGIYLQTK